MVKPDFYQPNPKGVHTKESKLSVRETMDLLARSVIERGATIYIRIDQQAEVRKAGLDMPPLEYMLFGSPEKGGRLMALDPRIALDLPLKIICWQDREGHTRIAFNDAEFITGRYGLQAGPDSALNLAPLIENILK